MEKHLNSGGYDLYSLGVDEWILNVKGGPIYVGSFSKVVIHAITKLGFDISEIEYAVNKMLENNHNSCHFGMYKNFFFTFNREFTNERKAS